MRHPFSFKVEEVSQVTCRSEPDKHLPHAAKFSPFSQSEKRICVLPSIISKPREAQETGVNQDSNARKDAEVSNELLQAEVSGTLAPKLDACVRCD